MQHEEETDQFEEIVERDDSPKEAPEPPVEEVIVEEIPEPPVPPYLSSSRGSEKGLLPPAAVSYFPLI